MVYSPTHAQSPLSRTLSPVKRQHSTASCDYNHHSSNSHWVVGKYFPSSGTSPSSGGTRFFDDSALTASLADTYLPPREAFAYVVLNEQDRSAWSSTRQRMADLISHEFFDVIVGFIIVVNAVTIGVEIDFEHKGSMKVFQILDVFFLSVFVLEAICKLYVFRLKYFSRLVNIGDFTIMVFGVIALVLHVKGSDRQGLQDDMRKLTVLKIARLLRLVRMLRLSTQFHSLWMIVQGLSGCINTVLWTTVLLMSVTYFFAILAIEYISSDEEVQGLEFSAGDGTFGERFANIPSALASLLSFFAIDNVSAIGYRLMRERPWTCLYFLAWTMMVPIVLLNLITAVIVEISINAAKKDESTRQAVENQEWQRICKEFEYLFIKMTHEKDSKRKTSKSSRTSGISMISGDKAPPTSNQGADEAVQDQSSTSRQSWGQAIKRIAKSLVVIPVSEAAEEEMVDITKKLTKQRVFQLSEHEEIREKLNMLFGEAPNSTRGFDRLMELWVVLDTDDDNQLSLLEFTEGMGRLHNVINSHNSDTFVMLRMVQELKKAHEERAQQSSLLFSLQKSQQALCQQVKALAAEVHALSNGQTRGPSAASDDDAWDIGVEVFPELRNSVTSQAKVLPCEGGLSPVASEREDSFYELYEHHEEESEKLMKASL